MPGLLRVGNEVPNAGPGVREIPVFIEIDFYCLDRAPHPFGVAVCGDSQTSHMLICTWRASKHCTKPVAAYLMR
jgi:hypothetical protein